MSLNRLAELAHGSLRQDVGEAECRLKFFVRQLRIWVRLCQHEQIPLRACVRDALPEVSRESTQEEPHPRAMHARRTLSPREMRSSSSTYVNDNEPLAASGAVTGMNPSRRNVLNCTPTDAFDVGVSSAVTLLKNGHVSWFFARLRGASIVW